MIFDVLICSSTQIAKSVQDARLNGKIFPMSESASNALQPATVVSHLLSQTESLGIFRNISVSKSLDQCQCSAQEITKTIGQVAIDSS